MPSNFFRFKQFTVFQERTAMKVGTDGVLLGCLAMPPADCRRVLDVGTGTGLVALMLAQRLPQALVHGIDIDPDAVSQATDNCSQSPFASRISIQLADAALLPESHAFDLVVSNPPFYANDLQCPDSQRNMARHTVGLGHEPLMKSIARSLAPGGRAAVILPAEAEQSIAYFAQLAGLHLCRVTQVFSVARKPAKRVVCQFVQSPSTTVQRDVLTLLNPDGSMSNDYMRLTHDFYLDKN